VLDLAARSCPARTEGTVFALLMSSLNVGRTGATLLGGWLYDHTGLTPLVLVSAGFTALCWLLVPFLPPGTLRLLRPICKSRQALSRLLKKVGFVLPTGSARTENLQRLQASLRFA